MAIKHIERLSDYALAVFDIYDLVAAAGDILGTGIVDKIFIIARRIKIGNIALGDLQPGQWRKITTPILR